MEDYLDQIAEKIIHLDEAALTGLLPKYKQIMDDFQATKEWEKAVVIFFLINAVRVKNTLFNDNVVKQQEKKPQPEKKSSPGDKDKANLKLVKS